MIKTNPYFLFAGLFLLTFTACKKEKPEPVQPDPELPESGPYQEGVFTVNEGPFSTGSGTVTFYDPVEKKVVQEIFQKTNNRPVGNLLQSLTFHGGKGYLVVNNGAKVEVVDAATFESTGTIGGFTSPRYFAGVGLDKAYVSDWDKGGVAVVDLRFQTISRIIPTGNGPEQMVVHDGLAYVANTGDWTSSDNRVTIIDIMKDEVVNQLQVGDRPNSLAVDRDGKIWILCGGNSDWQHPQNDTPGQLVVYEPGTGITKSFDFSGTTLHPNKLAINEAGDKLFYLSDVYAGSLYSMSIYSNTLPVSPLVSRSFYGLAAATEGPEIYAASAGNFSEPGWVIRYNESGSVIDSFPAGIIPGNFAVK